MLFPTQKFTGHHPSTVVAMQDRRLSEIRERTHFCSPSLEFAHLPPLKLACRHSDSADGGQLDYISQILRHTEIYDPSSKGFVSRHYRRSQTTTLILTVLPKTTVSSLTTSTPRIMQSVKFVRQLLVVDQCMVMSRTKEKRFS